MALSNAEKQARFRQRKQQRLEECVTPADIRRAAQLLHEGLIADWGEGWESQYPPWSEVLESCRRKRGGNWTQQLPGSADPDAYPDSLSQDDRAFLAKVGGLVDAILNPPTE